jgi:hypothetical protein
MRVKVAANCPTRCGVRLEGEVDTSSREFIHHFTLPAAALLTGTPRTEIEGTHLATLAPDSKDWFVACPLCSTRILLDTGPGRTA